MYVVLVVVLALVVIVPVSISYPVSLTWGLLMLALVALVIGSIEFELPLSASVSLGFSSTLAGVLYAGSMGGVLAAALASVSLEDVRRRRPFLLVVGNTAQLSLSAALAGLCYQLVGGATLQQRGLTALSIPGSLVAIPLAAGVFFALNVLLVAGGVAIRSGERFGQTLSLLHFRAYLTSLFTLALLGVLIAGLLETGSIIGLLSLVIPFAIARRTFRVYVEASQAYTETVKSLVTAIEAKDPYTSGHSERVAEYARRLAEAMSLSPSDVILVERAGLLHDIGKLGVAHRTLLSDTVLSSEETAEMREHPVTGGQLLREVEFLSNVIPVVRHHHERVDGGGYPDGLSGDKIPLLARVLATADAYDAMTSDRAYRRKMSADEARDELIRVAGSQLDEVSVSTFCAQVLESPGERAGA